MYAMIANINSNGKDKGRFLIFLKVKLNVIVTQENRPCVFSGCTIQARALYERLCDMLDRNQYQYES